MLPHREVVMPAFLCHEVRKAAEVAGKRIIYVDVAKNNVNASSAEFAEAAKPGRVLLAAHALGIPTDIEAICELARSRNCVLIEDAAAAFGGRRNGRFLGTFGDIGIFSFERSKRFAAFRGAAIVVNNDRILDLEKLKAGTETGLERSMPIRELIQALAQNLATTPWIYRRFTLPVLPLRDLLPRLLSKFHKPRVSLNVHRQAKFPRDAFYSRQFHPYQAELVLRMVRRMDQIRERIAYLVEIYLNAIRGTTIASFLPPGCDNGGLMRFPVAFPERHREDILRLARKRGLYLKVLWDQPLAEKGELGRFPNAVWAAQNVVMLPLYSGLSPKSAELLAQSLIEIERNAPAMSV
jgi:dTDP-4-amino-4,6-dideoxygalactose transaminase